jgi:hypothetical protein
VTIRRHTKLRIYGNNFFSKKSPPKVAYFCLAFVSLEYNPSLRYAVIRLFDYYLQQIVILVDDFVADNIRLPVKDSADNNFICYRKKSVVYAPT